MPETTVTPAHWHAYAYAGSACSDGRVRSGQAPLNHPPIEIKDWLHRDPLRLFREAEIEAAVAWLEQGMTRQLPVDADAFPVPVRLGYARARLQERVNRDVVWGYYSVHRLYASQALILCEDPGCQA